jgi:hypothetical protein
MIIAESISIPSTARKMGFLIMAIKKLFYNLKKGRLKNC